MQILIVDQCSASKTYPDGIAPVEPANLDGEPDDVISRHDSLGIPAVDLYSGKQQQRVDHAVNTLRTHGHNVDRFFISAGFGLVAEDTVLPPYDATFNRLSADEIQARATELGITTDLVDTVSERTYDIVFLPLGADYYAAIDISRLLEEVPDSTTVILFNREIDHDGEQVVSLPARLEEARTNGSTVVGLKGLYLKRFAERVRDSDGPLHPDVIADLCLREELTQSEIQNFL